MRHTLYSKTYKGPSPRGNIFIHSFMQQIFIQGRRCLELANSRAWGRQASYPPGAPGSGGDINQINPPVQSRFQIVLDGDKVKT